MNITERLILPLSMAIPILFVGILVDTLALQKRAMRVQARGMPDVDESLTRQRVSPEIHRRTLEIAEENLAIQHEIRDLMARTVAALERRV